VLSEVRAEQYDARDVGASLELFAPYLGGFVLTAAERADAAVRFGETR